MVRGRGEAALLALALLAPVSAWAQDEQPPAVPAPTPPGYGLPPPSGTPPPLPPEPAPLAPAETEGQDVRLIDAHADRYVFFPSGEVLPAGSFAFGAYELAVLRFAYGITDDLMLDVMLFPPWDRLFGGGDDFPLFLDAGVKINVVRTEGFRASVFGAGEGFIDLERGRNNAYALRLGGAGQVCFEPTCHSHLALSTMMFFTGGEADGATILAAGVGIAGRVSDLVSFVAEPATVVFLGEDSSGSGDEGGISWLSFGLRLSRANFGLDIVGIHVLVEDAPVVLPFVAFTYRSDPSSPSSPPAPAAGVSFTPSGALPSAASLVAPALRGLW